MQIEEAIAATDAKVTMVLTDDGEAALKAKIPSSGR
jgi:hypothetical protein